MAYNDFSLDALLEQFQLETDEGGDYFAQAPETDISEHLQDHLHKYVSRAVAIGTEKARSEFIVVPVLLEVVERTAHAVSIFSGVEFNADPDRGLRGVCDYLFSLSPEQLTIRAPVMAVVEAKNDNLKNGFGQCIAEMVAAQVFNHARNNEIVTVFGAVTTGTNWIFLRLKASTVYIDRTEYYISQPRKIVGIMLAMIHEAAGLRERSV